MRIMASRHMISEVALELFIVFVGVSAAFAVDNYRDARAQSVKRHAVYDALDRDLELLYELARFYNRANSAGDLYQR